VGVPAKKKEQGKNAALSSGGRLLDLWNRGTIDGSFHGRNESLEETLGPKGGKVKTSASLVFFALTERRIGGGFFGRTAVVGRKGEEKR